METQVPLKEGSSEAELRCFCLKTDKLYHIGRERTCDIIVNFPKISRRHLEVIAASDGSVSVKNCGRIPMTDNKGGVLDPNGASNSFQNTTQLNFKHKEFHWFIRLRKLPDIKVSSIIGGRINDWIGLQIDPELSTDSVKIDNIVKKIENVDEWISKLNDKRLARRGELYKNILPQTVEAVQEVISDSEADDEGYIEDVPNMIEVKPYRMSQPELRNSSVSQSPSTQSQYSRPAKRGGVKSQLEMYLDESDDSDEPNEEESNRVINKPPAESCIDLSTATKMDTSTYKEAHSLATDENETVQSVQKNLAGLNLRRKLSTEHEASPSPKKMKIEETKTTDVLSKNNKSLADVFKRTKQMKIEKLAQDEQLVNSIDNKNGTNAVKVKRFVLSINNWENPKIYTNFKRSFESDPRWENRLNYSKFVKKTNGSDYNPIMDSTIKTVRMKSSNYKSNEMQVNLDQDDDIMPELDVLFDKFKNPQPPKMQQPDPSNSRKRRREPTLFVESDYEDTQPASAYDSPNSERTEEQSIAIGHTDNKQTEEYSKVPQITAARRGQSVFTSVESDDDTPMFRSRKK